jgi:hypothetical protein
MLHASMFSKAILYGSVIAPISRNIRYNFKSGIQNFEGINYLKGTQVLLSRLICHGLSLI